MKIVNLHQAKTHLSKLIDEVLKGEPFVIAKAGRPDGESHSLRFSGEKTGQTAWFYGWANLSAS